MADLETARSLAPMVAEFELANESTPLRRAAGRLLAVLPPRGGGAKEGAPPRREGHRAPRRRGGMAPVR
ncbi:hypothetical protein [Nocardia gipuzkoensis]|uniref:hypothetical protein n=1 Tax=Nocardia gipuzkoensis TaxID=2749991 RepID=UPI0024576310|nr:hypothetical protein [Nocardia gipuzkoensis]